MIEKKNSTIPEVEFTEDNRVILPHGVAVLILMKDRMKFIVPKGKNDLDKKAVSFLNGVGAKYASDPDFVDELSEWWNGIEKH